MAADAVDAEQEQGADTPTGNTSRDRKPTEASLEVLIDDYRSAYIEHSERAVEAAVEVLEEGGALAVRVVEAREAFLRELLPILEYLEAVVSDAVRIGAARRWDPTERGRDIERLVEKILPVILAKRQKWLEKMATDFVTREVLPVIDPDDAEQHVLRSHEAARGFSMTWRAQAPDEPTSGDGVVGPYSGPVEPGSFIITDPDKVYEFDPRILRELLERGYRFAKVRAVEATEHDVWFGDDLAYVEASREDGVSGFIWMTSEDPLVCPVCDELDGVILSPGEAEDVARDRVAWTHCRCRCWLDAVEDPGIPV